VAKLPGTWKARHFVDAIVKCRLTAVTVETGKKGMQRAVEKAAGGRTRLYSWQKSGWQMGPVPTPYIPDAAGGVDGHQAAKLHAVIHRNIVTRGRKVMSQPRF